MGPLNASHNVTQEFVSTDTGRNVNASVFGVPNPLDPTPSQDLQSLSQSSRKSTWSDVTIGDGVRYGVGIDVKTTTFAEAEFNRIARARAKA